MNVVNKDHETLTPNETELAKNNLLKNVYYPKINRKFRDTIGYNDPQFALFSYITTEDSELNSFLSKIKDYLENQKGKHVQNDMLREVNFLQTRTKPMIGIGKIRGAFQSEQDAKAKAEEIIRDYDSVNSIFTCMIGVPFPIVAEGHSKELDEINIEHETEKTIAQNVREKRDRDKKEIDSIKQRKEELLTDVDKDPSDDPMALYIQNRVKLAHLRYYINAYQKQLEETKQNEEKCKLWLKEKSTQNPEFEKDYLDIYMKSRRDINLPDSYDPDNMMKYINDPL